MDYCFGVDIGGTTIKMGLFATDGYLKEKWEIKTRTEQEGQAILPDTAASILEKMKEFGIDKRQVKGIGLGIPAPVNREGIVTNTANLGWGYKEVKKELEDILAIRVEAGNDANVAALGEMWKGGGKGQKNMIMVTLGTGVGGGVIVDGNVVVGENGAGGEIGHICVDASEHELCGCGKKGCLEQYASATGISRLASRKLENNTSETLLEKDNISAKAVFDAVKKGDKVAEEVAQEFGRYLGHALANLAVITDPAVVVIGGGVSKAGDMLIPYIEQPFRDWEFFANENTRFTLAQLGNDAGIYGAAMLVLND